MLRATNLNNLYYLIVVKVSLKLMYLIEMFNYTLQQVSLKPNYTTTITILDLKQLDYYK